MTSPSLPPIADVAEMEAFIVDSARWAGPVGALAASLGWAGCELEHLGGGNLVVAVGRDLVLKLAPPRFADEIAREQDALGRALVASEIEVPALLAAGTWQGWDYLLLKRCRGVPLDRMWASLAVGERASILTELGAFLHALHRTPASFEGALAGRWERYVTEAVEACAERQRRWGVPESIAAEIPAWIAGAPIGAAPAVFVHADLHGGNVLVERAAGLARATCVLDFADAMYGDPLFDLVTPASLLVRGDARCFAALLDGLEIPPARRDAELQRTLTAYAAMHRFNDLTRVRAWSGRDPSSLAEVADWMFPLR